ncbi:MAG TPA: SUMF1/EgtB/PvdO family nonheme iron enzyme [Polyangia bacterium]|nr:SUMF1/EgtB/PvdO family nonheme iron enzyme [Polyangia bacterium]
MTLGPSTGAAVVAALFLVPGVTAHAAPSMIEIPKGSISIGAWSPGDDDGEKRPDPPRTVVEAFSIDRLEVTVRDYQACAKIKACPPAGGKKACNGSRSSARLDHPMNCVTWAAADAFCKWKGGRLPTSGEWERAARGDSERKYPWGDDEPKNQLCWENEDKGARHTCPVGTHPTGASPFGVLDLAGNVAEWTSTRFPGVSGVSYVIRGGGFTADEMAMADDSLGYRTKLESPWDAKDAAVDLGFRCVKGGSAIPDAIEGASAPITTPAVGSPERKPMLDAVRVSTRLTAQFKVDWLRQAGDWAYFEGQEHRTAPPPPASVRALLRRSPGGEWKALETLVESADQNAARADFRRRLQAEIDRSKLPAGIFPADTGVKKTDSGH